MTKYEKLLQHINSKLSGHIIAVEGQADEMTLVVDKTQLLTVLKHLKNDKSFLFDELIDICGVDYLNYGVYDWETEQATEGGFSRGVERQKERAVSAMPERFAVVYHFLSTVLNQRLRVRVFLTADHLVVPSVVNLWKAANWFEREAYDLFGILFEGHPDLRRILTDYGFIGHPFRKDFPQSGHVEMRYDATLEKVIYEPVDLEPRVLVPKVIRDDNRYVPETGRKA